MPAKSQAQRAYIFQKFGKTWAEKHHFANKGPLPPKVEDSPRRVKPPPKAKGKGK